MEAPEKIYIDNPTGEFDDYWSNNKRIEYIRRDVFVKKACEWLRTHSEADYFELYPYNYCGAGNLNKKKMIEDFRKYLED